MTRLQPTKIRSPDILLRELLSINRNTSDKNPRSAQQPFEPSVLYLYKFDLKQFLKNQFY